MPLRTPTRGILTKPAFHRLGLCTDQPFRDRGGRMLKTTYTPRAEVTVLVVSLIAV